MRKDGRSGRSTSLGFSPLMGVEVHISGFRRSLEGGSTCCILALLQTQLELASRIRMNVLGT